MSDWKDVVKTVVPGLASFFGTPLAGLATKFLCDKMLGEGAKESDLEAAITSGTPETLVKLREIENEFKIKMAAMGLDADKLEQTDRASARAREVAIKDYTPAMLAWTVTIGFFAALVMLGTVEIPESANNAYMLMLGVLGTAWTAIVTYYFGSSAGSVAKDKVIQRITSS